MWLWVKVTDGPPQIFIQMLGPFEVFRDDVKMTPADFGSRKAKTLLQWLADARNTPVAQDALLDTLWPDVPEERALRSLRVRVSELRRLLAPDRRPDAPLERVGNGYMLRTVPGQLETDVDRFAAMAAAALRMPASSSAAPSLLDSLALYTGEYLSHDPEPGQWHAPRERYRTLFVAVAERLASIYESEKQFDEGIRLLRRLLSEARPDEGLYRALIRMQYLHGDQTGALRTFDECRTYLQSELGARPLPETLRLLKQVLRHEPLDSASPKQADPDAAPPPLPPTRHRPTQWPFLGRQAELKQLQRLIADLRGGHGGIVWMHGPSGIGKTRLMREAVHGPAWERGFRTVWIQGSHLNSRIPFAATVDGLQTGLEPALTGEQIKQLMELASSHLQQLTGWFAGARPVSKRALPPPAETVDDLLLRQEVLALFERLAQQMPLVFCVDDVQTLDPASRALVLALARRAHRWPLLIVTASRRVPRDDDLGSDLWKTDAQTTAMELGPLSVAALSPLGGHGIAAHWTRRWLEQLHTETSGEPFMLVEKLHAMKHKNLIDVVGGEIVFPSGLFELMTDTPDAFASPDRVSGRHDEFYQHWQELTDDERGLLQKAAILGDSLTLEHLERLSTKPGDVFQRVLEPLIRQGYFTFRSANTAGGAELSFTHSRLQHRTYHTMSRPERIWYHRRTYELLHAEAVDADELPAFDRTRTLSAVAFHALVSEQWAAAAEWSLKAAAAVKAIAPGPEVAALGRQAHQAAQRTKTAEQGGLLRQARLAFADALYDVTAYEKARQLYEMIADQSGADLPAIGRRLTMSYTHLNQMDKAQNVTEKLLAQAGNDTGARGRARLIGAYVHYRSGELDKSMRMTEAAIGDLQGGSYRANLASAHHQLSYCHWDLGQYGHALDHAGKCVDIRRSLGVPELANGLNLLGELYQDMFCTERALRIHQEALDVALAHGRVASSIEIWRNLGLDLVYDGQTEKGLKTLERAWRQVEDLNFVRYWHEVHLRSLLEANLLAHRPDVVRTLLTEYKHVLGPRETPFVAVFTLALAFLEGRVDEGEAMLARVRAFWDQTGRRARAAHVLLFTGQELMSHGHQQRAQTYLALATDEMDRICAQVPADVCAEIRAGRQYNAARQLAGTR